MILFKKLHLVVILYLLLLDVAARSVAQRVNFNLFSLGVLIIALLQFNFGLYLGFLEGVLISKHLVLLGVPDNQKRLACIV